MASSDFGIKVSQPGHDARTAGDEHLLFSSSWPLLKIHDEGQFDVSLGASDNPQIIATHDLDYYPLFLVFYEPSAGETRLHTSDRTALAVSVDDRRLKVSDPAGVGGELKGYYYVFQTNLEEDFEAPNIQTGSVAGGDSDSYGFRVTEGDIEGGNLRDHVIDSSSRSLMIHQVTHDVMDSQLGLIYSKQVPHTLPYQPMYLAYFKGELGYNMRTGADALGFTLRFFQQSIEVSSLLVKGEFSLVIFKDPLELTDVETIAS